MTNPETMRLITSRGPKYQAKERLGLSVGDGTAVKFTSMSDGTVTIVQITLYDEPIGTGVAKRHPKDARDQELGMSLALVRAFTDAAAKYTKSIDMKLSPPVDPSLVAVKQLRKFITDDAKRRKDIKRKAAREAHREIMGWDHTNYIHIPKDLKPLMDEIKRREGEE